VSAQTVPMLGLLYALSEVGLVWLKRSGKAAADADRGSLSWAALAALVVPVSVVFWWRMRIEEAALLETFGERYRDYMRRTRRLIPFIY
jgi:protein-S-isoprenylcysteine O-methyltransferase Ste14